MGFGLIWKKRGDNGKRDRESMIVLCHVQIKYYCNMFHLAKEGIGAERSFDIGEKIRLCNWLPKSFFVLFYMMMVNAYIIY